MSVLFRNVLAALLACATVQAAAQSYPAKAVHVVVPFPPVGAADLLTRALGKQLGETWGQAVVTDNRPGAGGNIGAEAVARSAPDGYTLLMAAVTTHAVSMSLYSKLGYDPRPIYDPTVTDLFALLNANNYQKGGWLLHMLRHLMGDEKFFAGIRDYYRAYRDRNALTASLAVMRSSIA